MPEDEKTYTGLTPEIDEEDVLKSLSVLEDLVKGESKEVLNESPKDEDLKKAESDEDDEDEDDEDDEDEDEDEDAEKSLGSEFEETGEIQKAVEVSAFLSDLVDSVRSSIEDLRKAVTVEINEMKKSLADTRSFQKGAVDRLVKAMVGETEKVATLTTGMEDLRKSLDDFGNAPVGPRKSTMRIIEKSFSGNDQTNPLENLRKSQVVDRLVRLVQQRDSGVSSIDVTNFELSGHLRPEVMDRVLNG